MGKGKYGSDSAAESVMYWTTDHGFDVDISEFIKSEKEEKTEYGWMCHVWRATVTWGSYSYELATSHFNMNILADDIKNHLIAQNFPDFSYKVDGYNNMTEQYYEETRGTFSSVLDRKITRYNPVQNEYTTTYVLRDDHYQEEAVFDYVHKGEPEDYIKGDFTKTVIKHCKKDLYVVNDTKLEKHYRNSLKGIFSSPYEKVEMLRTYYSISKNSYIQKLKFHNNMFEVEYIGDPFSDIIETNIKKIVTSKFPEYIL